MNDLHALLVATLPIAESQPRPDGRPSRGWTLRQDRLSPNSFRFDWIHSANPDTHQGDTAEREALRTDVNNAARRALVAAGYRVKPEGTGLHIIRARRTVSGDA